ncbi:MAG: hypothetical protein RIR26_1660 [Pseudomonadota bacterium]
MQKMSSYSWFVVLCGFLILLVTNGMTLSGLTVFDSALLDEFGWQRGELKLRDLITFAGAGFIAPLFGYWADKGHIKKCLLAGCLFLSAGFVAYASVRSLGGVYIAHALFGLSLASAGIVSVVFLVSSQVPAAQRSLALGMALVGSSFGNTLFPQLNLALLKVMDWRTAFLCLSLVPIVLLVALLGFVRTPSVVKAGNSLALPITSVLRSVVFWRIGGIAMITFFAILGVSSHLFLRLTGAGVTPQSAGTFLGLLFMMGLVGKLFSGIFAHKWGVPSLMMAALSLMTVGAWGIGQLVFDHALPWVLCFGLGWGALYTLIQISTVSQFGCEGAGRILGAVAFLEALGGGLGPWLIGLTYDRTGSYNLGFSLIAVLLFVALALSVRLGVGAAEMNKATPTLDASAS